MELGSLIEPDLGPNMDEESGQPQAERTGLHKDVNFVYVLLAITVAMILGFQLVPLLLGI